MGSRYTWDEAKRRSNLAKHGLDFANADMVLSSRYRLDIPVVRTNEELEIAEQTVACVRG